MSYPRFYPSASGIELWLRCEAKALGKYVAKVPFPVGKAAREGTRLHRLTQKWMVTGQLPPMHELAVHKIVAAIPIPGGTLRPHNIERVLVLPDVHGYMDWSDGYGRQGDLKFTSNVRYQRSKNPTSDTQRILYALDEFYRDPYLVTLKQTWSVSEFNGSRALRLDHEWTRKAANKAFDKNLAKPLDEFQEAVQSRRDWQTATKNFDACRDFNSECPMLAKGCKRSLRQRLLTLKPGKIKV